MKSKFNEGAIIIRNFPWRIDSSLRNEGVSEFYMEAHLLEKHEDILIETGYFFVAWGNESRMKLCQKQGGEVFIHYFSPLKYAQAVMEFVRLCLEHFGDDWLERGG